MKQPVGIISILIVPFLIHHLILALVLTHYRIKYAKQPCNH